MGFLGALAVMGTMLGGTVLTAGAAIGAGIIGGPAAFAATAVTGAHVTMTATYTVAVATIPV